MSAVEKCVYRKTGSNRDIVYIFSCPGQAEQDKQEPASGPTGANLTILIKLLHSMGHDEFPLRDNASINNAWSQVLVRESDGRTEASLAQIRSSENLDRLQRELAGFTTIVCFGKRAQAALKALRDDGRIAPGVRVAKARHLGFSSINQIPFGVNREQISSLPKASERTHRRMQVVAQELLESLSGDSA